MNYNTLHDCQAYTTGNDKIQVCYQSKIIPQQLHYLPVPAQSFSLAKERQKETHYFSVNSTLTTSCLKNQILVCCSSNAELTLISLHTPLNNISMRVEVAVDETQAHDSHQHASCK